MAKVLVSIKIFPSDIDVSLDSLKKKISDSMPDYVSVYRFDEEPVAFGLTALIVHLLLPEDKSGGMDEVESFLRNIEQISQFETHSLRRVSSSEFPR